MTVPLPEGPLSWARTRNYRRQVQAALVFKLAAFAISLLVVPWMLGYLGAERFGVWATLLGVLSWISLFDLGLGNGLRNVVATALAQDRRAEAAAATGMVYSVMALLVLLLAGVGLFAGSLLSWQPVFNTRAVPEAELRDAALLAGACLLLHFWLGLVQPLLGALQRTAWAGAAQLLAALLLLLGLGALRQQPTGSLSQLAALYGLSLVAAGVVLNVAVFRRYPDLRPHWRLDWRRSRPLFGVGLQFFVIQLSGLVVFSTDKLLIAQLSGPAAVTPYELVLRLFTMITFAHTLVSAPLWSAYTEAYGHGDLAWMRQTLRQQLGLLGGVLVAVLAVTGLARPLIPLWTGHALVPGWPLVLALAAFTCLQAWNTVFAMLINGVGALRPQFLTAVFAATANLPLALLLARGLGLGSAGVVLGSCCSLLPAAMVLPWQARALLRPAQHG